MECKEPSKKSVSTLKLGPAPRLPQPGGCGGNPARPSAEDRCGGAGASTSAPCSSSPPSTLASVPGAERAGDAKERCKPSNVAFVLVPPGLTVDINDELDLRVSSKSVSICGAPCSGGGGGGGAVELEDGSRSTSCGVRGGHGAAGRRVGTRWRSPEGSTSGALRGLEASAITSSFGAAGASGGSRGGGAGAADGAGFEAWGDCC